MSQRKIKKLKALQVLQTKENEVVVDKNFSLRKILKDNWKFLAGLCVGIFILYLNSLNGAFVSDDYAGISQNPVVADVGKAITDGLRSSPSLINAVMANIFGVGSPVSFHILSVIVYLISIVLFFLLIFVVFGKTISEVATVIFAVLPIHVEAVSWISGRPYLLNAIVILFGLLMFAAYDEGKNKKYIKIFFWTLPLLIYAEPIRFLAFPIILPVFIFTFCKRINFGQFIKKYLLFFLVLGIISLPFLSGEILGRINMVNSGTNVSESVFYDPLFQYPTAMTKYLQLTFAPMDLTLYHTMYILPVWLNWAVVVTYLVMLIYFYFKNKKYFFALFFIFAAAAPSMAPVKVSWLVAERYMYLGTCGFALLLALMMVDMSKHLKLIPATLFMSLVIFYSIRVWTRNIDWQTNHNLWVNTCQVSPNSHNAWNNIGDDYDKLKEYENSIKGFTQSTIVKPNYADAFHNRANIFFKIGQFDLARESYRTALQFSPGLFQTYLSLAQVDLMDKKFDWAVADATKATEVQPNNPQAWYVLGVVQAQTGQLKEATITLEKVLQMAPNYKPAVDALVQLKSRT